jgi:hypothetical protein
MAQKSRKVVVRGELREDPDVQLQAIFFLLLAQSLREQREAGLLDDLEDGEEVA